MSELSGKRILLVEDEFIVAAMAKEMLTELGTTVVGPAGTIASGLRLAETEAIDAAVLDVNMDGKRIDAVVEVLNARNIPIVFATGYGDGALDRSQTSPMLDKPYTQEQLAEALACALKRWR